MAIVHVTKDNFEEVVLHAQKKVLLDFWATWCGPCKMLAPVLEEIAAERPDLVVGKIDIDAEMDLAMQYKVTSIPTLVVVKDGNPAATSVGFRSKADVLKFVDQA